MQNLDVPDIKDFFRVAQLYIGINRQPWVIGNAGEMKSNKFLEHILSSKDLPISWEQREVAEEKIHVPSLQSPNGEYTVVGIGNCIKREEVYHFFDLYLPFYNAKIDDEHLKKFQQLNSDFKYEIHRDKTREPTIRRFGLINGTKS